jgi:hypothetical protein
MALILEVAVTNELLGIDIPYSKYVIIAITFRLQIFKIVFQDRIQVFKQTNARIHTGA